MGTITYPKPITGGYTMRPGNPNLPTHELSTDNLTKETIYRFAEIELAKAIQQLSRLFLDIDAKERAIQLIFSYLKPDATYDEKQEFFNACIKYNFFNPERKELIYYFRFNNVSYGKINKLTGISPNTISKYKYDHPSLVPSWDGWDVFMLSRWDLIKDLFNIWEENVLHKK
jgi:hypothetical protein